MKTLFPMAFTGLSVSSSTALAQEAKSIDQTVNEAFAAITGPFVSLIFAPIPGTSFP